MFCICSHASTKITMSLKYLQIIRPHQTSQAKAEEFFQRHLQLNQIPSSLRLAVVQVQVIVVSASAKPWCAARAAAREGVDAEAAADAKVAKAAEDVHSIDHVAPYRCVATARCGRCSARGRLIPAIGLAKVAQMV